MLPRWGCLRLGTVLRLSGPFTSPGTVADSRFGSSMMPEVLLFYTFDSRSYISNLRICLHVLLRHLLLPELPTVRDLRHHAFMQRVNPAQAREALPCDLPGVSFQEGVQYHDGSHVWICFPDLGAIEYHPFSIASTAADPQWCNRMLVLSKVYDRWTEVRPCAMSISQAVRHTYL